MKTTQCTQRNLTDLGICHWEAIEIESSSAIVYKHLVQPRFERNWHFRLVQKSSLYCTTSQTSAIKAR